MEHENFDDIAPYDDSLFPEKLEALVKEPGFKHAVTYALPGIDYDSFAEGMKKVRGKEELQEKIMRPFLEKLANEYTNGLFCVGLDSLADGSPRIFMTNHRDIVLDSAYLNTCFMRAGLKTSEIAIGNNLLVYSWIEDLVRLNKNFIVHRNIKAPRIALAAAEHLSAYIHHCIDDKKQSIWIAQREGRAKDSSDRTQESLIKMMTLRGEGTPMERLISLNITPTCLSYEYDPNDYLKAREFLMKSKDPEYSKTQRDDLLSMETGMLGYKGEVRISVGNSINKALENSLPVDAPRAQVLKKACEIIDRTIHSGYHIYPINYIACDCVEDSDRWHDFYTQDQKKAAIEYWQSQLEKLEDKEQFNEEDLEYMLRMMWTMYANPLKNKVEATHIA